MLAARPNAGVLWIDAHADINIPSGSESGNMHGMPVGLLLENNVEDFGAIPGFEWLGQHSLLKPERLVYVGLRDVDDAEVVCAASLSLKQIVIMSNPSVLYAIANFTKPQHMCLFDVSYRSVC